MWQVKYLKKIVTILALIPVATGIAGLLGLDDPIYQLKNTENMVLLDSNLRFFGGVWLTIGFALIYSLRRIEEHNPLLQWIMLAVVVGGVGRLISMLFAGVPPWPFIAITLLEIIGVPLLMYWQYCISQRDESNIN